MSPYSTQATRERDAAVPDIEGVGPRRGAKRTLMDTLRQIPDYLRLLYGLMRDMRVSNIDKLLVGAAIAYTLMPMDLIPDFIPFLGEVDDIFFIVTALQRLITNAGRAVVLDHWVGDAKELADLNLKRVLSSAAFFLPGTMRSKIAKMAAGGVKRVVRRR